MRSIRRRTDKVQRRSVRLHTAVLTSVRSPARGGRTTIALVVVIVGIADQVRVPLVRTRVQINLGQWLIDQFAVSLTPASRVKPIVEPLARESPLVATFPLTILNPLANQSPSHPLRGHPFSGQNPAIAGCKNKRN